jgi:hypothetical protein
MPTPTTFAELVYMSGDILNLAIRFMMAGVFVFVVWKIIDAWVINAGDEKKREEGKQTAIVSVFVMVILAIVWGLVSLLKQSVFGG